MKVSKNIVLCIITLFIGLSGNTIFAQTQGPFSFNDHAGEIINNQYSSMGILFNDAQTNSGALHTYAGGPNTIELKFVDLNNASIAATTDSFNLNIYGIDGGPTYPYVPYIAAYDYYGNLLGEAHATPPLVDSETQNLSINFSGMHELVLHNESWGTNLWYNLAYNNPQSLGVAVVPYGNPPVVPEPISSILFITGGTLLAGRRFLRRKA